MRWRTRPVSAAAAPGEVLEWVTADLLVGVVGDFTRLHGGTVIAQRDGDTVTVRLGGALRALPGSRADTAPAPAGRAAGSLSRSGRRRRAGRTAATAARAVT